MKSHTMHLSESAFTKIKDGKKTIETRLYDDKRRQLHVGDEVTYVLRDNPEERILTRVTKLINKDSFSKLFDSYEPAVFGAADKDDLLSIYKYYNKEDEQKFGVIGIEFVIL